MQHVFIAAVHIPISMLNLEVFEIMLTLHGKGG
jgi:hypothetical protein